MFLNEDNKDYVDWALLANEAFFWGSLRINLIKKVEWFGCNGLEADEKIPIWIYDKPLNFFR